MRCHVIVQCYIIHDTIILISYIISCVNNIILLVVLLEWNGDVEGFKGFLVKVTRPGSLLAVGLLETVDEELGHNACDEEVELQFGNEIKPNIFT